MAYETPITIKKVLDNIKRKKYVLPSIQREFVWEENQIEQLFDSLMRNYPIGTFLFWHVEKLKINDFQFYDFLLHYHELSSRHNNKIELSNEEDVTAILDGQQRMTSLYIGLCGSYAEKTPYLRWDSPHAFPKKKLYLNILNTSEDIETEFDFQFLSTKNLENINNETSFWFDCSKILEFTEESEMLQYLINQGLTDTSKYTHEQTSYALNTLTKFFTIIHRKGIISYFLEEDQELDKVLQIFIRINSGGTKLSYSDLLLSIATAQWKEKDAREIIHSFVDEINSIDNGFKFNKDLVLKTCLVLSDFNDIKFKVDNFTKDNMLEIERNWDQISISLKVAVQLISKLGYNRANFAATNAIIPIAYYILKNNNHDKIIHNSEYSDDRHSISQWLSRVLLKGTFGGQPDGIYPVMRTIINNNIGCFPLENIINHYKGKRKSIVFSEDEIDDMIDLEYNSSKIYSVLTLLYPSLHYYNTIYHIDHIHPKSFFDKRELVKLGVNEEDIDSFKRKDNKLPNLQLLESTQNIQKSNKNFKDWLEMSFSNNSDQNNFLMQHHINTDISLEFNDFLNFYDKRKEVLKEKLMTSLNVDRKTYLEEDIL